MSEFQTGVPDKPGTYLVELTMGASYVAIVGRTAGGSLFVVPHGGGPAHPVESLFGTRADGTQVKWTPIDFATPIVTP